MVEPLEGETSMGQWQHYFIPLSTRDYNQHPKRGIESPCSISSSQAYIFKQSSYSYIETNSFIVAS
jgi:hypothetical protein